MSEECQGEGTYGLAGAEVDLSLWPLLRSTPPTVLDKEVSRRLSMSPSPNLSMEHGVWASIWVPDVKKGRNA